MCVLFWDERSGTTPLYELHGVIETFRSDRQQERIRCTYNILFRNTSDRPERLHVVHRSPCQLTLQSLTNLDTDKELSILQRAYGDANLSYASPDKLNYTSTGRDGHSVRHECTVIAPSEPTALVVDPESVDDASPYRSYVLGEFPPYSDQFLRLQIDVDGPYYNEVRALGSFRIYSSRELIKMIKAKASMFSGTASDRPWIEHYHTRVEPNCMFPAFYDILVLMPDQMRATPLTADLFQEVPQDPGLRSACQIWRTWSEDFQLDLTDASPSDSHHRPRHKYLLQRLLREGLLRRALR